MKLSRIAASFSVAAAVAGCTAVANESVHFSARDKTQQVLMRDGESVITSQAKNTLVTVKPAARQVGKRPVFILSMENRSKTPIEFRVSNVVATEYRDGAAAQDLKVFTYEELVVEEKNLQVSRAVATGLLAGVNSGLAGNNYYARARADVENQKLMAQVAAQGQQNLIALEQQAIKDHTLLPGESHGGKIALASPDTDGDKTYAITVTLGPDKHEFFVSQGR
jgi:hypothetical protein